MTTTTTMPGVSHYLSKDIRPRRAKKQEGIRSVSLDPQNVLITFMPSLIQSHVKGLL